MGTSEIVVDEEIKDFSIVRRPIKFKIDDDVFDAVPDVAAEVMIRFADQATVLEDVTASNDRKVEVIRGLFYMVLTEESADLFVSRLNDPSRPIGMSTFIAVTQWLMEQYGLRPTESDSD